MIFKFIMPLSCLLFLMFLILIIPLFVINDSNKYNGMKSNVIMIFVNTIRYFMLLLSFILIMLFIFYHSEMLEILKNLLN